MSKATHYTRGVVVGCTHAQLMIPQAWDALEMVFDKWKPQVLIHLGDYIDTTALRTGADGTADEGEDIGLDLDAGLGFLKWYFNRPAKSRFLCLGNHDVRPHRLVRHPSAKIRYLAQDIVKRTETAFSDLSLRVMPYDIKTGWLDYGGALWGHGYMVGEQAVRDHAEMTGRDTYIAHLHRIEERFGRSLGSPMCRCIGWLGDEHKAGYARHRRQTLAWSNGFLLTEHSETETVSWQIRLDETGKFRLPF